MPGALTPLSRGAIVQVALARLVHILLVRKLTDAASWTPSPSLFGLPDRLSRLVQLCRVAHGHLATAILWLLLRAVEAPRGRRWIASRRGAGGRFSGRSLTDDPVCALRVSGLVDRVADSPAERLTVNRGWRRCWRDRWASWHWG